MSTNAETLLEAWFGIDLDDATSVGERCREWFSAGGHFDTVAREQFSTLPDAARRGDLADWADTARSSLALVIALDQLPRNLFRGTPSAFAYDAAALEIAQSAIAKGFDEQLHPVEAVFMYLPLEHAEDLASQERSVELCRALVARAPTQLVDQFESFVSYAERHHAVVERFGRFPHRNEALGRPATADELEYLASGGDSF